MSPRCRFVPTNRKRRKRHHKSAWMLTANRCRPAFSTIGGERFRNAGSVVALAYRDQRENHRFDCRRRRDRFWDAKTGITQHIGRIKDAGDYKVFLAVIDPAGKTAAVNIGSSVALYDLWRGEKIREWEGPDRGISAIALSPDGKTLFSGTKDKRRNCGMSPRGKKSTNSESMSMRLSPPRFLRMVRPLLQEKITETSAATMPLRIASSACCGFGMRRRGR